MNPYKETMMQLMGNPVWLADKRPLPRGLNTAQDLLPFFQEGLARSRGVVPPQRGGYQVGMVGPQLEITPEEATLMQHPGYQGVLNFIGSYPGSRMTPDQLAILARQSQDPQDIQYLRSAIAGSVAETALGRNMYGPNKNNMWNLRVGGDAYYDPEFPVMAQDVYRNYGPQGPYYNPDQAAIQRYTADGSESTWGSIYNWAIQQMLNE